MIEDLIVIKDDGAVSTSDNSTKVFCNQCRQWVWSLYTHKHCPKCGADPDHQEIRNYNMAFHDGDIHCTKCGTYVRAYDAG
jgi:hypothetical protein